MDKRLPKGCWIINILGIVEYTHFQNTDEAEMLKKIGNYFETEEEAERAVERLNALKRLKDKGIFVYLDHLDFQLQEGSLNFEFNKKLTNEEMDEADKDLDLLLGGEE